MKENLKNEAVFHKMLVGEEMRAKSENRTIIILFSMTLFALIFHIFKVGIGLSLNNYFSFLWLFCIFLGIYAYVGNKMLAAIAMALILISTIVQSQIIFENGIGNSPYSIFLTTLGSSAFALLFGWIFALISLNPRFEKIITSLSIVALSFLLIGLLISPQESDGATISIWGVQPIEPIKILSCIVLADISQNSESSSLRKYSNYLMLFLTLFVLAISSEFGGVLLIALTSCCVVIPIFIRKFSLKIVISVISILAFFPTLVFLFSSNHFNKVYARIVAWINPFSDPFGISYQVIRARKAMVLGGATGVKDNLPYTISVQESDYVFSKIIYYMGALGGITVLTLCLFLFIQCASILKNYSEKTYPTVFARCFLIITATQSVLNIGGNLGLLPVTGVPLLLVSKGTMSFASSIAFITVFIVLSSDKFKGVFSKRRR